MSSQLSDVVKELIAKARIVSFAEWEATHPPAAIALFQTADNESRYLTDAEFGQIQILAPDYAALVPVAKLLRDRVVEIVDEARAGVLTSFPGITAPGGGLYPSFRAEACWRDFWHFLRCISYGIAGYHTEYTSQTGLYYMKLLYEELQVPLDAMLVGLEGIKTASLKHIDPSQQAILAPYFDHLIIQMTRFKD